MKQWFFLWIVAIGISATLSTLTSCDNGKNIPSAELPLGKVVKTEYATETITTYSVLVATPYGLERAEIDLDMYNYMCIGDSIILPQ